MLNRPTSDGLYHEYMFIQNYYNVLVIKSTDLGTLSEQIWPKMNTEKTANIHQYIDKYKRFSLFVGYSNKNEQLKENDNLFTTKGIFFIINDTTNKIVHSYVQNHNSEIEIVSEGLADKCIDLYMSKNISKTEATIEIIQPLPKKTR